MWPRIVEILLGCWLIASAWLLPVPEHAWSPNSVICGSVVVVLATLSFHPRLFRLHLAEIPIGLWMIGLVMTSHDRAEVMVANEMMVALTLLNFVIIPSPANQMPRSWRAFYMSTS